MEIKSIKVGEKFARNNIFLAPMAGYTDYAIRKLQSDMGIGLTFTELVSAKGLMYKSKGNGELLYSNGYEQNTAVQLFGADPYYMRSACESEELKDFSIVDINMGCPVPKVFKNGEGSALLTDIKKAENIVKECVKSKKTITVKIRIGQKKGDDVATEFCKMAEASGASLVTIHGRTREEYYSGEPNFRAIEKAKKSVDIPVIANGGIFTVEDADRMIKETGADGVMLARGAIADPFLICKLLGEKSQTTLKNYIIEHVRLMAERYPDYRATIEFRKFTPYYFKGMVGVKDLKTAINSAQSTAEIIRLISENL
jgi:nifR3 family TIM-barrel protein